ncbi:oxidoreductase NAD-binding domain-containing protein 1 isoform X4 [Leptonychotes weddellii]|uniref:Oxidoreductase NAD-binding domain-containing protein 1 isoform X4 n=1 Tax=Leptonychotes weddellii TaxID=9713 RepID=A0A7F8RKY3_LEPWE|nr:oxidoreductase NAD-binding domain-containing protein 1 isoform X4 [Leptonychotes weddellii]
MSVSQPATYLMTPKISWTSKSISKFTAKLRGGTMVCAAVAVPGLLRSSAGTVRTPAASLRLTASALRHLTLASIMKSKRKTDHLERTANVVRRECTLDSEVAVRVGGEFFFDPQPADASRNLVLIAGGVGINPLLSILRHTADLHRERAHRGSGYEMGTTKLFYSAQNTSELLFKKNILDLVNEFPEKIACSLHVTKQTAQISAELKPYVTEGRITEKEIRDHISQETLFYICGPPPMTDFFSKQLENSHVPKEHICFEKWW